MSLVTTDEVIEQVSPGVGVEALQSIIDREEKFLARRIGDLTGERTVTYRLGGGPIRLPRTASAVVIAGVDPSSIQILNGRMVYVDPWPYGAMAVTWEPDDEEEVKQAIIDLCRITLSTSPYVNESSEGHSYARGASIDGMREAIVARITEPPRSATVGFGGYR